VGWRGLLTLRPARNGEVLEQTSGFKQLAVRQHPDGHTHHEPVSRELAEKPCLDSTPRPPPER
jgi:hypothetical protein